MEDARRHHRRAVSILLLLLSIVFSCNLVNSLSQDEISAMNDLRNSLGAVLNASASDDPCTWSGFRCAGGHITEIYIKGNDLTGKTLPASFSSLTYLTQLQLQGNNLTGPLPTLKGFSSLQQLLLNNNNFTSVPSDCFDGMTSLQSLFIDQNPLLSPWPIPAGLSTATGLNTFSAVSANINGSIPSFLGTLPSLTTLHLSFNNLQGGLPDSFSGSSIQSLWLNSQKLSGSVAVLQNMTSVAEVWLHGNSFTGPLPDFTGLTNLQNLSVRDNQLTGPVPDSLIKLPQLKVVKLANNNLQGPTPKFASSVELDLTGLNNFCTEIPGGQCDPLVNTLLSILKPWGYPLYFATRWTGNAPCSSSWLGLTCSGNNVTRFEMSNKNLSGTISSDFSLLTSLQVLNLSNNNLTGTIPTELTKLTKLKQLDLSNNNLYGNKPSFPSNVIVNVDGNPNFGKAYPSPPSSTSTKDGQDTTALKVGLPVGIIVVLALVGVGIWWGKNKLVKRSDKVQNPNSLLMNRWPDQDGVKIATAGLMTNGGGSGPSKAHVAEDKNLIISIEVLRKVTDNFSKENILGRGGFGTVYKGELPDGTKIAVKRMETGMASDKGLDEFTSEISVMTKVRHRHLVSLLGYCLEGNERLLVYEYLPQGTLSRFLFHWKEEGLKPLDWARRLIIALDVARGVEYLHVLANQSFIHRDLKPSNILLGDNMRAKVADFGLVRLAPDNKASFATRLAGTFGYLAPEYAVTGRVTTKVDVYSFGVILMELITGRKSLDESKPEDSMHLVSWFRRMYIIKDMFPKAIDPEIQPDEETLASICKVAELAVHCTAREPHQRPDMNYAVNVLSSLAELWQPSEPDSEDVDGINLDMSLSEALHRWQAFGDGSQTYSSTFPGSSVDNTQSTIPVAPPAFVTSLKSSDGR
ncbi:unnamed protein product [Rhodiola kirilowii]